MTRWMMILTAATITVACGQGQHGNQSGSCQAGAGETCDGRHLMTTEQKIQYGPGPYYCGDLAAVCPRAEFAECRNYYCVYRQCASGDAGTLCPPDRPTCDTSVAPASCRGNPLDSTTPPTPVGDGGSSRPCRASRECMTDEYCLITSAGCSTAPTGQCVKSRDLICRDTYYTEVAYCACAGYTSWQYGECIFEQYRNLGPCVTDGGAPDAGVSTPDAGLPDAGVSIPDAGTIADAGTSVPDAGTTTPDAGVTPSDGGVTTPADGGTPPTIPQGANGVVRMVIDASRVGCTNAHLAAFANTSNWAMPVENGTLSLDVPIYFSGIMDTTIHCGPHSGSTFAPDYSQYGANGQTATQVGYREVAFYAANGSRIDLLSTSLTCNNKLRVPLGNSTATCP